MTILYRWVKDIERRGIGYFGIVRVEVLLVYRKVLWDIWRLYKKDY